MYGKSGKMVGMMEYFECIGCYELFDLDKGE